MDKTILAVSFGTSHKEAIEACIHPVEKAIAAAFPDYTVRRAFTSRVIRAKLAREGMIIESPEEAIATLGSSCTAVASTHMIPGQEYERLCALAAPVPVSEPLLYSEADLTASANLLGKIRQSEGRVLIVMGHGTDHIADETYRKLRACLPEKVYLACVEGSYTLDTVLPELKTHGVHSVTLMPLMLVAGDHAKNDMAGDGPDSWRSRLIEAGFDVKCRIEGLGTLPEIQAMFVRKVKKLIDNQ